MKNLNGLNQLNSNLEKHRPFNLYYKGEMFSKFEYNEELKRYQSDYGYLTPTGVYQIETDETDERIIEWL